MRNNYPVIKVVLGAILGVCFSVFTANSATGVSPLINDILVTSDSPSSDLVVVASDPFSSGMILPTTPISSISSEQKVKVMGCKGEIEPASLIIRSSQNLHRLNVVASDLVSSDGKTLSSDVVDIHLVKCWYQAGNKSIRRTNDRVLTPELLLKDDRLIKVDHEKMRNFLRVFKNSQEIYIDISDDNGGVFPKSITFDDAVKLMPFDLNKNSNQQLWVTVAIPSSALPGTYNGKIAIESQGIAIGCIPLQITILPFNLKEPLLEYAMYYRGVLSKNVLEVGSEKKNTRQYQLELADMLNHGISSPTIYQQYGDFLLEQSLKIRSALSFSRNKLYTLGTTTANPTDAVGLFNLANKVKAWKSLSNKYGYKSVYIYGIDEAVGEKLTAQRLSWDVVHREGVGIFVALYEGAVERAGDDIDVAILSGFKPIEVLKWHQHGKRILCYGNPQVGVEDPAIYRRNYGFMLWDGGYDGCMPYAYQHGFGNIWNDFDHPEFRDHVFAYPTSNGLVETIQWEGFREAVDDIRYLSTALLLCRNDEAACLKSELHNRLSDQRASMGQIRSWLIDWIMEHSEK